MQIRKREEAELCGLSKQYLRIKSVNSFETSTKYMLGENIGGRTFFEKNIVKKISGNNIHYYIGMGQ